MSSSDVIGSDKDQHETSDDFIIIMLVIALFVLCCIIVFCIMAALITYKAQKKLHHDQSEVNMSAKCKVDSINNSEKIQSSNIVKLDEPGSSDNNNMQISCIQLPRSVDIKMKHDHDEIRSWLQIISFSQYFNNFVLSGYESIEFIKEIKNESELQEIGISSISDCNQILCEIDKLRMIVIHQIKDTGAVVQFEILDDDTRTTDENLVFEQDNEYIQKEGE